MSPSPRAPAAGGVLTLEPGAPPASPVDGGAGRARHRLAVAACLLAYGALGILANLPVWLDGPTRTIQAAAYGDIGQEVWFLASVPAALAHGHDPLVSTFLNAPWGVNVMDNTAMPLAGLLGWPVTATAGPIATYNVLFSLAVATSAASAFAALRRYVASLPAAFLGGLLYGASPYLVGQGMGHLFLVLVPLLPVFLWCLDEILVRQRRRPWRAGALLGACAAAQLGLSIELLAWAGILAGVGTAGLAIANRRRLRARLGHAARALATAAAVFAALAAFPLFVYFAGHDHLRGPVHPPAVLRNLSADAASFVVPTTNQRFDLGLGATGNGYVVLQDPEPVPEPAEAGSYVGLPLLAFVVAGAIWLRRDRTLRFAVAMAAAAAVFSLGGHLHLAGHDLGVPLPYQLVARAGALASGVAGRFAVFMWLFLALAVAVIVDRGWPRARRSARAGLGALLVAGLVALAPAWPYAFGAPLVPAWFTSPAAAAVPAGSTLLTYPIARSDFSLPMVWQALDAMRFRIPGGEAAVRNLHISTLERLFDRCLLGRPEPPATERLVGRVRADLSRWRIDDVVVPRDVTGAACAVHYLRAAIGRAPLGQHGSAVWRHAIGRVGR